MGRVVGRLEPRGAFIYVKVMASPQFVAKLKAAGRPFPAPSTILALIDTGASISVVDSTIIGGLGLVTKGPTPIHTPTTGAAYQQKLQYDASLTIGRTSRGSATFVVNVIGADLASEGFLAILGWDILNYCVLTCNGPAGKFSIDF